MYSQSFGDYQKISSATPIYLHRRRWYIWNTAFFTQTLLSSLFVKPSGKHSTVKPFIANHTIIGCIYSQNCCINWKWITATHSFSLSGSDLYLSELSLKGLLYLLGNRLRGWLVALLIVIAISNGTPTIK